MQIVVRKPGVRPQARERLPSNECLRNLHMQIADAFGGCDDFVAGTQKFTTRQTDPCGRSGQDDVTRLKVTNWLIAEICSSIR